MTHQQRVAAGSRSSVRPSFELPTRRTIESPVVPETADSSGPCQARAIESVRDLDELADAWDLLAAESGSPMQHSGWFRACLQAFGGKHDVSVVVVGDATRPAAIAPLVRRRDIPRRLELPGVDELHEPMDFLFVDSSAVTGLAEGLVQRGLPLFLKRIPADSPVVSALRGACRGRGIIICRSVAGYPWIPLDSSWAEPEQHLTSRRRSDLRRAQRIAEKLGSITVQVLSPTPAELPPLLEEAFQVEAAGWKGHRGSALAMDGARGAFYSLFAAYACEKRILRVCFLRIGGRAAAMQVAVECGNRFWLLKIGYDEQFARCSPGILLLRETIRYAVERRLLAYEFLGSVEPWVQMWAPLVRPCVSIRMYPASVRGIAALVTDLSITTGKLGRLARRG